MSKIKFIIELNFESWFYEDREPKTKEDWETFLNNYYVPDASILGIENEDYQDMIAINGWDIIVTDINI